MMAHKGRNDVTEIPTKAGSSKARTSILDSVGGCGVALPGPDLPCAGSTPESTEPSMGMKVTV